MGYSTQFKGELLFTEELTASQISTLDDIFGEDLRDHPDWVTVAQKDLTYVDLEFTNKYAGLQWDGAEKKTYDLVEKINWLIGHMQKRWPNFGLKGEMIAQGEEMDDRWILRINAIGLASKVKVELTGKVITCPCCEHQFVIGE